MDYYKANQMAEQPFIYWVFVASSLAELTELGLYGDPLIVAQSFIPTTINGVYPLKIVFGELVERSEAEIDSFEPLYNSKIALRAQALKIDAVVAWELAYDGKKFPMDEASRLFYMCMEKIGGDQELMTTANISYSLLDVKISDFMTAYYTQLHQITSLYKKLSD